MENKAIKYHKNRKEAWHETGIYKSGGCDSKD